MEFYNIFSYSKFFFKKLSEPVFGKECIMRKKRKFTKFFCVSIVGYVDMITYPLTKYYYIIERVYFIYRLFILFASTFLFLLFFYTVSRRYKRDYLHSSMDISFYIMFYIMFYTR